MLDPRSSQLGSTTDHQEKTHSNGHVPRRTPLEIDAIICTGIVGTCNCFGRICESRGLSNLTPARSRLFKFIGKDGVKVELQQALSIYGG